MEQQNVSKAWGNASITVGKIIKDTLKDVEREVSSRGYRASNELRNASAFVLRGKRSGRVYKKPGTYGKPSKATKSMLKGYGRKLRGGQLYRASAPGEAPAVRTGIFRLSWGTRVHVENKNGKFCVVSAIESNLRVGEYLLGDILEYGTARMAPRPYKQAIKDRAMPKIMKIYERPYQ